MKIDSNSYSSVQTPYVRSYEIQRTSAGKWRVGTLSMGLSLLMVGIVILISHVYGYSIWAAAKAWWPIYFCSESKSWLTQAYLFLLGH